MDKFKKLASSLGNNLWPVFLKLLEDKSVEFIMVKVFGLALNAAGFKAYIAKFLAKHFTKDIIVPSANIAFIEGKCVYRTFQGKGFIETMEGATNVEDYNDAVDDILS